MIPANPRVCVMSGGDEVRYRSYINHSVYARIHGFTYHIGIGLGPAVMSPYYYKFNAILEILPAFEWVLYLDDDVYVTDLDSASIELLVAHAEEHDEFLVLSEGPEEPDGTWTRVNSGVMLVRRDERSFELLRAARDADLGAIRDNWSEADEGLFTNGDQDAIWRAIRDGDLLDKGVRVVGHRDLNSREHYYRESLADAFAVHFCGPGDKRLKVAEFGRRFGLGQELVPRAQMELFSVRRQEHMSDAESLRRRVDLVRAAVQKRVRRKIDFVATHRRWR